MSIFSRATRVAAHARESTITMCRNNFRAVSWATSIKMNIIHLNPFIFYLFCLNFKLPEWFKNQVGLLKWWFWALQKTKISKKFQASNYMNSKLYEAWIIVIWIQDSVLAQVWQKTQSCGCAVADNIGRWQVTLCILERYWWCFRAFLRGRFF